MSTSPGAPGQARPPGGGGWWTWKRFLLGGVLIVALTVTATATAGLLEVDQLVQYARGDTVDVGPGVISDAAPGKPQTILILGSDRRYADKIDGNPARSDTILLVRLDPGAAATTVLSIPRDLKAHIFDPKQHRVVTDKINSAYSRGGPGLTARTIKSLLGVQINHIVNINFGGFRDAVNYLGCVYTDVDRRYYNPPNTGYAVINVKQGYEKLCGKKALQYVRYRHGDTDIVRNARQQSFLRDIKDQVGTSALIGKSDQLARLFGRYTQTDRGLRTFRQVLRLLNLGVDSAGKPVVQVKFPVRIGESYVYPEPAADRRAVAQFLHPPAPAVGNAGRPGGRAGRHRRRPRAPGLANVTAGVVDAGDAGRAQAASLGHLAIPAYYPELATPRASYVGAPRSYQISDRQGRGHAAYRMVVSTGGLGQYYGIQGTSWRNPPILDEAHETRRVGRRTFELYYDGHHLRLVAWRHGGAVYWVINTLSEDIGNRQLLAIASSLRRG